MKFGTGTPGRFWRGLLLLAVCFSPLIASAGAGWRNIKVLNTFGGRIGKVAAGNVAYLNEGYTLVALRLARSGTPTVLGRLTLPSPVQALAPFRRYVVAALQNKELVVIDAAVPARMRIVGTWFAPFFTQDLAIAGNRAYLAAGAAGLQIVSLANPTRPTFIKSFNPQEAADSVAVVGHRLYFTGEGKLQILDLTNPDAPTLLGLYFSGELRRFTDIAVAGSYAYLTQDDIRQTLTIIKITNPARPTLAGTLDLPAPATAVVLAGGVAFLADNAGGLQAVNIRNPARPVLLKKLRTRGSVENLAVFPGLLLAAEPDQGMEAFNIINPFFPIRTGYYESQVPSNVAIAGNLAYITTSANGLKIIDISKPARPRILGRLTLPDMALGIKVRGRWAYIANFRAGLTIVDVSNPLKPTIAGRFPFPSDHPGEAYDVELRGNTAYMNGFFSPGVFAINVANPTAPKLISFILVPSAQSLAVVDSMLYLAVYDVGLQIIDISNPSRPVLRGRYVVPGNDVRIVGIDAARSLVYLTDFEQGLLIIDVSNPNAPTLRGSYGAGQGIHQVTVMDDLAFIATSTGTAVIDVSNPSQPRLRGQIQGPSGAITVNGNLAYVADGIRGLVILIDPVTPAVSSSDVYSLQAYD